MDQNDVTELFRRIRSGDRAAAGEFVLHYAPLLRRRMRGKMGWRVRRVFDSQDILSTVLRRLDSYLVHNTLQATTEMQMWALVLRIAESAVLDKGRLVHRLKRVESEDESLANALHRTLTAVQSEESFDHLLEDAFASLEDETERTILWLWLTGHEHRVTASLLGIKAESVRKKWERMRQKLRESLLRREAAA